MINAERANWIRSLRQSGKNNREIAEEIGVSKTAVWKFFRRRELGLSHEARRDENLAALATFWKLVDQRTELICLQCRSRIKSKHGRRRNHRIFCQECAKRRYVLSQFFWFIYKAKFYDPALQKITRNVFLSRAAYFVRKYNISAKEFRYFLGL